MGERKRRWLVVGLCGLAFVLRVVGLDAQSLWRDEVDAIRFALRPLSHLLETFVAPGQNGPLYSLLLRPWLGLAGTGEVPVRFFSLFFGVLAVPLLYRLARRLFPHSGSLALVAALLAATSPYLVWYGQEGKMYTLVVALVLLSMDRYLAALEEGGWQRWLAYVLATSAVLYIHLIAVLIVPAQALLFLILPRRERGARWKPWLGSMAALTVPYLPLLAWQLPLLVQPAATGFRFVPLHEMLYSLLVSYGLGVVWGGTLWTLALFLGLVVAAGLLWREAGARRAAGAVVVAWLVVPIAGFFAITLVRPLYTARYLIFVLPAFLLLLAAGVTAIAGRSRLLAGLLLGALLAVNGWGLWQQAAAPVKADFRAATSYVARRLQPDDLILFQIPYGRFSFDYYYTRRQLLAGQQASAGAAPQTGSAYRVFLPLLPAGGSSEPYHWADGLYTNAGMVSEEAARLMAEITAGSRVVWFVATETPMWDERGLVQAWLDQHATRTDEAQFTRVAVYRYELRLELVPKGS
jgi:mannosyltransferase